MEAHRVNQAGHAEERLAEAQPALPPPQMPMNPLATPLQMQPMRERAPYLRLVYSRPATGTAMARSRQASERRPAPRPQADASRGEPPQGENGADAHFAHWVDAYLQEIYDGIVEQPLPDEISTLIEDISGKSKSRSKK
ncbi:hypothetical protein [Oceanibaculum indicum]|uniref:hypothetical protein n=1 Tax=Oceanibaculum indicum TaxID=526216 RepID=UPI0011C3BDC1|nr:hypothetical protein [Oceanibaculum indicum]